MRKVLLGAICGAVVSLVMLSAPAYAAFVGEDPLHGFCWGTTPACTDNGTNTPTSTNPPSFGFTISPGAQTGSHFVIDVLVPNTVLSPALLSFLVTGIQGGAANNLPLAGTATLFSLTAWTSGRLEDYLGISAAPNNPIGAFLPSTQLLDPSATGFFVYQVDLGENHLQKNADKLLGPLLNIAEDLPLASYIVGFLNTGTEQDPVWVATANSGAIFETGLPELPKVPLPASLILLGAGLLGVGFLSRRRSG